MCSVNEIIPNPHLPDAWWRSLIQITLPQKLKSIKVSEMRVQSFGWKFIGIYLKCPQLQYTALPTFALGSKICARGQENASNFH